MENNELRTTNRQLTIAQLFCVICALGVLAISTKAQSIDQSSPTPIVSNEISGRILARDVGDARLTSFFYTFDGTQGDVFINVVTTNFNGDIDIFTAANLRPLTKITAYADSSNSETGRVFYLRQPLKLILRIEGRSPNDDAATFQIKFAGSFAPSTAVAETETEPQVKSAGESDVRVNSVGTIIEVKPKPTPTPKETIAKVEKPVREKKPKAAAENEPRKDNDETPERENTPTETAVKEKIPKKESRVKKAKPDKSLPPAVGRTEETAKKDAEIAESSAAETKPEATAGIEEKPVEKGSATAPEKEPATTPKVAAAKKKTSVLKPIAASELASINLVVLFKDGSKIERPMSEVLKFSVDKGILTVIAKDGAIGRYSILDVEKITVQ